MEPCHHCADATNKRYSWGVIDDADARITRPLCDDCAQMIHNISVVMEFSLSQDPGDT